MLVEQGIYEYVDAKERKLRRNTMEGYLSAIKCHLLPRWQGRHFEEITQEEVQAWVDSFERPGAAKKAFYTFRQVVRWLLAKQRIRIWDYTIGIELPRCPRREKRALSARQLNEAVYAMRGEEWEAAAIIQASAGLRGCEAVALLWSDVNLKTGIVRVTKGLHEAFGEVYESEPKSPRSYRDVLLPHYALLRLRQIRKERAARPGDRICDMRPSAYRRRVRAWFRKRGVRMAPLWLRHTFGTRALEAGWPMELVAAMMGHESLDMLYEHYMADDVSLYREQQKKSNAMFLAAAPPDRLACRA